MEKDKISLKRIQELHPKYIKLFESFYIEICEKVILNSGFWRVTQAFRSPEYQADLHKKGISPCDAWQSPHNYGVAIDLGHIDGKNLIDFTPKEIITIKHIANKKNIVCGIDFIAKDTPHFEIADFNWHRFCQYKKDANNWAIIPEN